MCDAEAAPDNRLQVSPFEAQSGQAPTLYWTAASTQKVAVMTVVPSTGKARSPRTFSFVAVAAISLAGACGTGAAALAGLLPASKGVALAVTATPLVDIQIDASLRVNRNYASDYGRRTLRREPA
jgi:hypothetical protein